MSILYSVRSKRNTMWAINGTHIWNVKFSPGHCEKSKKKEVKLILLICFIWPTISQYCNFNVYSVLKTSWMSSFSFFLFFFFVLPIWRLWHLGCIVRSQSITFKLVTLQKLNRHTRWVATISDKAVLPFHWETEYTDGQRWDRIWQYILTTQEAQKAKPHLHQLVSDC